MIRLTMLVALAALFAGSAHAAPTPTSAGQTESLSLSRYMMCGTNSSGEEKHTRIKVDDNCAKLAGGPREGVKHSNSARPRRVLSISKRVAPKFSRIKNGKDYFALESFRSTPSTLPSAAMYFSMQPANADANIFCWRRNPRWVER